MRRALASLLLLLLAMAPVAKADGSAAETGADPGPASLPSDPMAPNELYLEVTVNAESTGLILRFTQVGKGLRSSVATLQQLGLDPARLGAPGQAEVALDAIPGLSYDYDAARQSVSLQVVLTPSATGSTGSVEAAAAGTSLPRWKAPARGHVEIR